MQMSQVVQTPRPRGAADLANPSPTETSTGRVRGPTTPTRLRRMRTMIVATTILSCVAALVLTLGRHETVVSVHEHTSPALLDALEAHAVLSDADRAVWASFRSGKAQLLGPGQEYQDDITTAGQAFARLAGRATDAGTAVGQLQTINGQLVNYQGLVGQADATYRSAVASATATSGDTQLGYAYLSYASKSLRDPEGGLLAGIDAVAASNRRTLADREASAWTSPWLLVAYASVAFPLLGALVYTQRFLRRRFRRALSPPLVVATAVVVGLSMWLCVATLQAAQAFRTAHDVALPRLSGIWHTQTRSADEAARALRADVPGRAPARESTTDTTKPSRGLDMAATRPARTDLESAMAAAADTGGLLAASPIGAAGITGLAVLGLRRRLDEYRG